MWWSSANRSNAQDEVFFIQKQKQEVFYLRMKIACHLERDDIWSGVAPETLDYWPTIEENPRKEYSTPFLATLAFSALLPDGEGNPQNPSLNSDVSFNGNIKYLLKFAECANNSFVFSYALHSKFMWSIYTK